jgi:acyl-coenzyme A synthetase/AMP-(fatty) acid ligase
MQPRSENLVVSDASEATVGELADRFERERIAPLGSVEAPVAYGCATTEEGVAAAAALARTGLDGLIVPAERLTEDVREVLAGAGFAVDADGRSALVAPPVAAAPVAGRVSLLTSGTTGVPKVLRHRWDTLFTQKRAHALPENRWLLTYQTGTYAWFQMVTLALFVPGQQLLLGERLEPAHLLGLAARHGATAISSTPTFWRYALLRTDPDVVDRLTLRQISLGGERVDQAILDQLRARFPAARITHIYASTEVGAAIVVNDGREGFPAAWLDDGDADGGERPVRVRVQDGTLHVRSRHASTDHGGWVDTGDSVELRDDRVIVIGRRDTSFINVGGMKVTTYAVERALLENPDVAWCRVGAQRSALVGSLVAADVVLRTPGQSPLAAESELARHARTRLPEHAVPRLWRILDAIPVTGNLKTQIS